METVTWSGSLSIGVDEIDAEHRYYAELLHRFNKAGADGFSPQRMRTLLNDLLAYFEMHFQNEEAFMREAGYPGLGPHVLSHRKAAALIKEQFAGGLDGEALREFLNGFLLRWLMEHIQSEDRAFGDWLAARGGAVPGAE